MNEAGSGLQESVPLADRETNESDFVVLEISETAVDQTGGLSARAAREVSAIDERSEEAPARCLPRDPGADDAAPDDEDVEQVPLHPPETRRPRASGELVRHVVPSMSFPGFMIPPGRALVSAPATRPGGVLR
jgi:hypothetical protein